MVITSAVGTPTPTHEARTHGDEPVGTHRSRGPHKQAW
jgi:hypothetical protein